MAVRKNNIYNVDCLEGIKNVETGSVKLICADPPYAQGMTHNGKKGEFVDLAISKTFFQDLFREFDRVLADDGEVFFFCDWKGFAFYYPLLQESLPVRNMVVWDKISGIGNMYAHTYELIIYASKKVINKKGQNIWREKAFTSGAKKTDGDKVHPTQKPKSIIRKIINEGSKKGDLILDPFSGSGTVSIVGREEGRDVIAFELSGKHFETSRERVKKELQAISLDYDSIKPH